MFKEEKNLGKMRNKTSSIVMVTLKYSILIGQNLSSHFKEQSDDIMNVLELMSACDIT